jgi:UDP-GlcNAc:undecaprenyl-phosphate GlcNAc-1-phosphate transferase
MWALAIALALVSTAVSALVCGAARLVAPRFGLVDTPGGRKAHRAPTPLGGGVSIWAAVMIVLSALGLAAWLGRDALPPAWHPYIEGAWIRAGRLALLMGLSTLIMLMGLADDRVGLGWKLRLGVQFALAAIYVFLGEQATFFQSSRWLTALVTIIWIVGLTNAFNFLDNMDALAASVALIVSLLFAGAQLAVGSLFVPAVLVILAGALAGFLFHNRPPARLFMGDAGSNFIGFLLGTLTVTGTFTREGFNPLGVLAPILIMAVPLYDTVSVILIRIREGRSPFEADRKHFSHRLVERGLTPAQAVATIDLVTLAAGLGALLLHRVQSPLEAFVILGQTFCVLGVISMLEFGRAWSERRPWSNAVPAPLPQPAETPKAK